MEKRAIPILATDIGYGDTKYGYELEGNFKVDKFPTAIARVDAGNALGEEEESIEYQGKNYILGKRAIGYYERLIPTRTPDFNIQFSPLILYEIFRKENIKPQVISISLSIAEFKKKKEKIAKVCSKFFVNNEYFEQEAIVLPQGVGIWKKAGAPENALIIDIGHNTVDVLTIKEGRPDGKMSFGIDNAGTSMIVTEIRNYILREYQENITEQEAKEILKTGKFKLFRKEIPLNVLIEDLKKSYSEKVLNMVLEYTGIKEFFKRADKVIIAGGGAYFFSPDVREKYGIDIPKRPEFANVEGFFEILQEMKQNT
jgi:plasmid segregation protein ParM